MGKKRRQAVGHPLETAAGKSTYRTFWIDNEAVLKKRAARWKAAAKRWRKLAHATNPANLPWLEFKRLIEKGEL